MSRRKNQSSDAFAADAIATLGWWKAHRFLLLRRLSQLSVLLLFAIGPLFGLWLLKGNLSASLLLDTVPLADPLVTLQSLASGHLPELSLLLGAAIVALGYGLLGGRVFCSWVCPVNMVTDTAAWLRRKLGLPRLPELPRSLRYYLLVLVLFLPPLTGLLAWEWLNPVPVAYRALLFGGFSGLWLLLAILLLDLFVSERAWCSHLCPSGALYSLLGKLRLVNIEAVRANDCNNCMDCFTVCPERQVLKPALKGSNPTITSTDCTLCGRCIDVCAKKVFEFDTPLTRLSPKGEAKDKSNKIDCNRIATKAENKQ
ncbi:quinol dehydrogenase ferredoxin subunit NapH [Shewanella algae]|uniref:quinol dehydrogenase ferredoxin subunit NapH n=1 Tax=Shewanella algae TaxID=38313 RepID=UPI000D15063A|nr:quinol dehydrogenase ferredoxin subunit NapH [Shewanella algae]PST66589.1 quinol dehydrogenase ferredoxin subunit NapH [Shewanella algae]